MSALNLTRTPSETERLAKEAFVRAHAAPAYRELLTALYDEWHRINDLYFGGQLLPPHLGVGLTHPRRLSHCRWTDNSGGAMDITISERAAFATDDRLIREPWPSLGGDRLLKDLLLGETNKQWVMEVHHTEEEGYGGYGTVFAAKATEIGERMQALGPVVARRRGETDAGRPVAASWPWAFRPEGYYLGHVDLSRLLGDAPHSAGAGTPHRRRAPRHSSALAPGIAEYLLHLAVTDQIPRQIEVLGRLIDAETARRAPVVAAHERRPHDASGNPLPLPIIDPAWLLWNDGCVRAIAEGIRAHRAFDGLPILADALQDAGCADPVILDHCRQHAGHTASCWVLRLLTAPAPV